MSRSKSQLSLVSILVVAIGFIYNQWQKSQQPPPRSSSRTSTSTTSKARARLTQNEEPRTGTATSATTGVDSNDGNLLLGNPTRAGSSPDNFLIERPQYSMSYNRSRGGPNWVAWHVDYADLGSTSRGKFAPDPDLPLDWRITPKDYTGSGFDRGHMCPSGDRTADRETNNSTFFMSNMVPQTAALNQHVWADLEDYVRTQVRAGNEAYQITGVTGNSGTIAGGKVTVPASCWKVVVIIPEGTGDLKRINGNARVIAVSMPNQQDDTLARGDWHSFITTAKKIEQANNFNLFASLPIKVSTALETKVDAGE